MSRCETGLEPLKWDRVWFVSWVAGSADIRVVVSESEADAECEEDFGGSTERRATDDGFAPAVLFAAVDGDDGDSYDVAEFGAYEQRSYEHDSQRPSDDSEPR